MEGKTEQKSDSKKRQEWYERVGTTPYLKRGIVLPADQIVRWPGKGETKNAFLSFSAATTEVF